MAIIIVCQSCHQRFKVNEKYAGRKGPCPKCKSPIYIPKPDEQVQVHVPEHSEEGARGRSGKLVLKPISRTETRFSLKDVGITVGIILFLLLGARLMRGAPDGLRYFLAIVGVIGLAPPLVWAGYAFLRNDELEAYSGRWLWIRTGICAAVYAFCWGIYCFVPAAMTDQLWKWAFLGPVFGVAGATAAFACFDLDYLNGFFHFTLYVGATLVLGLLLGLNIFGG